MTSGQATIGDGVNSFGTYNATDFATTDELFSRALMDISVIVLPGLYAAPLISITLDDNASVIGRGSPVILAGEEPVFAITGGGIHLSDLTLMASGVGFEAMINAFEFERVRIERVRFIPDLGRTCIFGLSGRLLRITDCDVGPVTMLPGGEPEDYRAYAHRVFDLYDVESGRISGNSVMEIGDNTNPVDAVLRIDTSTHEGGHFVIDGNTIEGVVRGESGHVFRLHGRFFAVGLNQIGRCPGDLEAISLTSGGLKNGSVVDGGSAVFVGNQAHNSGAPVLGVDSSNVVTVVGNTFSLMPPGTPSGGSVSVDQSSTSVVVGNNAEGN